MKTLTIELPDCLNLNEKELKMILASKLYELGELSLGQGAEMVGYSKKTFMELLGAYGVSIFNYPPEDIEKDVKNAGGFIR